MLSLQYQEVPVSKNEKGMMESCFTLMICSCTPSSVWGPRKQLQMVSNSRSISRFPGAPLSGAFPVICPYAMSFCDEY